MLSVVISLKAGVTLAAATTSEPLRSRVAVITSQKGIVIIHKQNLVGNRAFGQSHNSSTSFAELTRMCITFIVSNDQN